MAKKFTRNITNTKLTGKNKEPLHTNKQNDLLSDEKDVFIRNQDEYHNLTDNLKEIKSKSESVTIEKTGKNEATIEVKETEINSTDEKIKINKNNVNDFTISTNDIASDTELKQLKNKVENIKLPELPEIPEFPEVPEIPETKIQSLDDFLLVTKNNVNDFSLATKNLTNQQDFKQLEQKVNQLEQNQPEIPEIPDLSLFKETTLTTSSPELEIQKQDTNDYQINVLLDEYAKKTDIENIGGSIDLSGYVKEEQLPNFNEFAKVSQIPDTTNLITQTFLNGTLSEYLKKSMLNQELFDFKNNQGLLSNSDITLNSNSNGSYLKMSNGLLICFHTEKKVFKNFDVWRNGYYSSEFFVWTFPYPFKKLPIVIPKLLNNHGDIYAETTYVTSPLNIKTPQLYILALDKYSILTAYLGYFAIGWWK